MCFLTWRLKIKLKDQSEFKIKLSKNIKKLREKQNLTQGRLANLAFVSTRLIQQLEDTDEVINHTIFPLIKIARYFNITVDELMYGSTELDEEKKLFYKIKSLSSAQRALVESFIMHN